MSQNQMVFYLFKDVFSSADIVHNLVIYCFLYQNCNVKHSKLPLNMNSKVLNQQCSFGILEDLSDAPNPQNGAKYMI